MSNNRIVHASMKTRPSISMFKCQSYIDADVSAQNTESKGAESVGRKSCI